MSIYKKKPKMMTDKELEFAFAVYIKRKERLEKQIESIRQEIIRRIREKTVGLETGERLCKYLKTIGGQNAT